MVGKELKLQLYIVRSLYSDFYLIFIVFFNHSIWLNVDAQGVKC